MFLKNIRPHPTTSTCGPGDMEGDTSHLTSFSNNGERPSESHEIGI
jgi:hypothetical protein